MAPKDFWEPFGFKTAKENPAAYPGGRKYGIRIPTVAPQVDPNGDADEGGDNEGADIDINDIGVDIPDTVPEEHWPDYEDFKDDLQKVVELLQSTNAAKVAAEEKVKDLEARVAQLEANQTSPSVADVTRDRDKYKALYEAEAEKVRNLQASVDSWIKTADENKRLLQELQNRPAKIEYVQVPGPERVVYQQVPGPERVVYQNDSRWAKARHEILAYRSVAWSYHPLKEQVDAAVANGTYLSYSEVN